MSRVGFGNTLSLVKMDSVDKGLHAGAKPQGTEGRNDLSSNKIKPQGRKRSTAAVRTHKYVVNNGIKTHMLI